MKKRTNCFKIIPEIILGSHNPGKILFSTLKLFFGIGKTIFVFVVDDLSFIERAAQLSRKWLYEPWIFMTPGEKINRRKWQNVRNKRVLDIYI